MSRIVLPSDFITGSTISVATQVPKLIGHGLEKRPDGVYALMAGVLHENEQKMWLNTSTKRYVPHSGDRVLGTVTAKAGDYFKVDIGSIDLALLNFTSFEGATKRNRPNVKVGDLIYGLVILTSKQLEPELSCVDSEGRARGMGLISAPGLVLSVSLGYARRLLSADCKILAELSKQLKFETTIGMNGTIWIGGDEDVVMAVRNALIAGETMFDSNIALLVQNAVQNVHFRKPPAADDDNADGGSEQMPMETT
ncbi:hypothetical protein niasHT_034123 [Heterodera trifolii]|uniref:Ribosomal RNA-processing protein 40 n=1 Tax=Heterodera trifolii TaxID=157864 RepID=A0ABD2J729_9BILA